MRRKVERVFGGGILAPTGSLEAVKGGKQYL